MAPNPYYDQGFTWNTSKDGQNHYDPGPSPGSNNQPSHTPDSGYSNNTPASNPINAPGGDDYKAWNWEQVLNGVLGMKLPDRSLVSGLRWTVTDSQGDSSLQDLKDEASQWGTAPTVRPASVGRDFADLDEDTDYDDFAEPTAASRRAQYRQGTH